MFVILSHILFSFEEIKRKLTKGRKPKAHEPSNHSLQRLKRKRQAVKTVVGELILYVPDSSILIYHASFFMNLGCKPVRVTLCTRMSWTWCSVCFSTSFSQVTWQRENHDCCQGPSNVWTPDVPWLYLKMWQPYSWLAKTGSLAHVWQPKALEEAYPQPLLQMSCFAANIKFHKKLSLFMGLCHMRPQYQGQRIRFFLCVVHQMYCIWIL